MTSSTPIRDPHADPLLTPQNAALVIIDFQPVQVHSIASNIDKRLLVANVTARPITEPAEIVRRLIGQVTGTVRWRECVAYMAGEGVTRFYEIGAGKVLSGLVKRIADGAVGVAVSGPNDIAAAKDALAAAKQA